MRTLTSLVWTFLLALPVSSDLDNTASQSNPFEQRLLATIPEGVQVEPWRIQFAPNGRIVAYGANKGGERHIEPFLEGGVWWIVVGEKRSEGFDVISNVSFAPDGRKVAFAAKKAAQWSVWCDGKRLASGFTDVGRMVFSPDGKTLAYEAWQEGRAFLVVGEKRL